MVMGGVVTLLASQPVLAEATQVKAVRLSPNGSGLEVVLETETGDVRPQIFPVSRGNDWVADIVNAKLNLSNGDSFRQENPMPGVDAIVVRQLEPNTIRVTVSGAGSPPDGQILQQAPQTIALGISAGKNAQTPEPVAASEPPSEPLFPVKSELPIIESSATVAQRPNATNTQNQAIPQPADLAQTTTNPTPATPPPEPEVLVPNPTITIEGRPAPPAGAVQPVAPVPPFLPRAVAPPLGDIAISNINAAASTIDLGTAARVPRLSLREAPVREVLSLLARSAGLNIAFIDGEGGGDDQQGGSTAQQRITLDLENEPVQDVFNYVLQISGFQANRRGRTIFVGAKLPVAARNLVTRTLRLNQVNATSAANFLTAQGAETQIPIEQVQIQTVGEGAAARTIETRTPTILALKATETDGTLLLRGLSVVADERLNSVTLVGEPRQVEIASAFLTQLDLRRRQVAVNVKVVDVDLSGEDAFSASFSFGVDDAFFVSDRGSAVFNYGQFNPPTQLQTTSGIAAPPVITNPFSGANVFLDANNPLSVPGTLPGTVTISPNGAITRTARGAADFASPTVNLDDPLQGGVISITQPTDNIVTQTLQPNGTVQTTVSQGTVGDVTVGLPSLFQFPDRFLTTLQAQIVSGNAKILTDPTLVVQEGETAQVNLTQEVVGNISSETESSEGLVTRTIEAEIREAGLILEIIVDRIDDNGFITLAVNPTVSSIGGIQDLSVGDDTNQIALLNVRQLQSGRIRLRDSQTLILSGIIQEADRTTVSKVPILGDLPIIGALFRSTNRVNERNEVIVLLTPQILDDSGLSGFGYNYTPGREVRQLLQR
ncbi:MAG: AMIN domain-containing protein [Symploca sp. SIO1B1]|nr:AMIN domain-containing protein [Symploca sp. SIO1C2]NER94415.1 AMIN domain-containing protein [Symploca sp. SIO1B1]